MHEVFLLLRLKWGKVPGTCRTLLNVSYRYLHPKGYVYLAILMYKNTQNRVKILTISSENSLREHPGFAALGGEKRQPEIRLFMQASMKKDLAKS